MPVADCPNHEQLLAFASGHLADEDFESIARHLTECPPCGRQLEALQEESDTFLQELDQSLLAADFGGETGCRQALVRFAAVDVETVHATEADVPPEDATIIFPKVDAFLDGLVASNLLPDDEIENMISEVHPGDGPGDSRELAAQLVERGTLTAWQARMLLSGRKAFFLGKYKLLDELGQGGMGMVLKAQQVPIGRTVAIKVITKKLVSDEQSVARFRREIRAAAALDHPNIVHAYDADVVGDHHFLVMEYVAGEDLGAIAKRLGRLPVGLACELVRQAALGLQHAHERGMVHRDIKPGNLLLVEGQKSRVKSGNTDPPPSSFHPPPIVKILDMGLARISSDTPQSGHLTATGQIMGTPDYIAPEQASDAKSADIRSDIFSLGCTLFRLVTGDVPFQGRNLMERLMARAERDAPPLRSCCDQAPAELEAVVAKMLARNPSDRYQSPQEVAVALAPFAKLPDKDETKSISAIGLSSRRQQKLNLQPTQLIREHALEDTTGLIGEFGNFLNNLATEAARDEELVTVADLSMPTAGNSPVNVADRSGADKRRLTRRSLKLQQELKQRRQADRKRLRWTLLVVAGAVLFAIGLVVWQRSGQAVLIVDWPDVERSGVRIQLDGRKLVLPPHGSLEYRTDPGTRHLRLTRDGYEPIEKSWTLHSGDTESFQPKWVPTDETLRKQKLAVLSQRVESLGKIQKNGGRDGNSTVALVNPHDPQIVQLRDELNSFSRSHYGTPQAASAASLLRRVPWPIDLLRRQDVPAEDLQLAGGEQTNPFAEIVSIFGSGRLRHYHNVTLVKFRPDGNSLVSVSADGAVKLWDARTGREQRTLHAKGSPMAIGPGGKIVVLASGNVFSNSVARFVNVDTAEEWMIDFRHKEHVVSLVLSRDASLLAEIGRERPIQIWDVQARRVMLTLPRTDGPVAFSDDGTKLAAVSSESTLKLWDVETGQERLTLKGSARDVLSMVLNPQGDTLAVAGRDRMVRLWNIETGDQRRTLRGHTGEVWCVAFSPDGETLASGGQDSSVKLWDVDGGRERLTWQGHPDAIVQCLDFSPDGKSLASGGSDRSVRLWDAATGNIKLQPVPAILCAAASPDGKVLATGQADGNVRFRDLSSGAEVRTVNQHRGPVHSLAFSPDGHTLASGCNGTVALWSRSGQELGPRQVFNNLGDYVFGPVNGLLFDPSQEFLATHDAYGYTAVIDLMNNQQRDLTRSNLSEPALLAFGPDGKTLPTFERVVGPVAVSPDASTAATQPEPHVLELAELTSGRPTKRLATRGSELKSAAFSPDGKQVASAWQDGMIEIYDVASGKLLGGFHLAEERGPGDRTVTFTPDGRHLVMLNRNGTVYIVRLKGN